MSSTVGWGVCLQEEPAAITIHGRTLAQMYRGEADWAAIASAAEIARGTATLILGNGDIQNMNDVIRRVQASQVNGVLIGRATLGVPWFFRHKERARSAFRNGHGEPVHATGLDEPGTLNQRLTLMLDHARQFESLCGRAFFQRMRKHLGWYCKGFPHAAAMRARMFKASSLTDVEHTICDLFGEAVFHEVDSSFVTTNSCACGYMRLILASTSPRRKELLALLGYPFDVVPLLSLNASPVDDRPIRKRRSLRYKKPPRAQCGSRMPWCLAAIR